ncbi:DUF4270 family protein [uncultured Kriegella sp.]|uniref:DUF4270 family protein n=1 Tax=uncultured Kriegella sp. TaxID=1798910 RepID=UPI0030D94DE3
MKRETIHKVLRLLPSIIILFPMVFAACDEDAIDSSEFVAGEVFTESNIRVIQIDTITVETSTVKFDSLITSQSSRVLVGKYVDPEFGTVRSASYFELLPTTYTIDSEAEFDSIAMYLKLDKYYYNDTLKQNTIQIKELNEAVKAYNGDDLYNTGSFTYKEEDLGTLSYTPRPISSDSLEIRLSDSLGIDIFKEFQEKSITNLAEFNVHFKGMALLPGETDDGSIIGFSLAAENSYMRLYFSTAGETERLSNYIDFTINTTSSPTPFFNQITTEDPNEYLKTLTDKEIELKSANAEDRSFIQSGVGIATRIQFPHIKSIYDIPGEGTILNAVLKLKPTAQSFDDHLILRDSLSVYLVDVNNDLTEQLSYIAVLNRDNQEFNDIYYELSLSSYIEKLLVTERYTGEALVLLPDNYNSTVDRFILNGNNSSDYSTTLELTYSIYDEVEN